MFSNSMKLMSTLNFAWELYFEADTIYAKILKRVILLRLKFLENAILVRLGIKLSLETAG